jgi:hypothetical protein
VSATWSSVAKAKDVREEGSEEAAPAPELSMQALAARLVLTPAASSGYASVHVNISMSKANTSDGGGGGGGIVQLLEVAKSVTQVVQVLSKQQRGAYREKRLCELLDLFLVAPTVQGSTALGSSQKEPQTKAASGSDSSGSDSEDSDDESSDSDDEFERQAVRQAALRKEKQQACKAVLSALYRRECPEKLKEVGKAIQR